MELTVIVLAAGQGTRMRSALPKVLHPLAGRPLLAHVLSTAHALQPAGLRVVYGHGGERVPAAFPDAGVDWVLQDAQLGTGHAVQQALPGIPDDHRVLVLYGDVPLTDAETLRGLLAVADEGVALLSVELDEPTGYGRIVRDVGGAVREIVEERDADAATRTIGEVNTGILAAPAGRLRDWLGRIDCDNSQGEYYLTDAVGLAVADGVAVAALAAPSPEEVLGVNSKAELAYLERYYQRRAASALLDAGVTLIDPERFDLRGTLECGRDVSLDVGVVVEGDVVLDDGVSVGPYCVLRDTRVGDGAEIHAHSVVDGASIGPGCRVGPFARVRPGTVLGPGARVGNFVEVKMSDVGAGSKINHLSYVGDAEIGRDVNVGAGTITCNYDGHAKHRTRIGDGAFIGSGTELVAPVEVGAGATVGAGSTVTRDAPDDALTVSRAKQRSVRGWRRPGEDG